MTQFRFACQPPLGAHTRSPNFHGWIGTETVRSRFGEFEFRNGYPTAEAAEDLYELRSFNRAVEAYLTHMPAVSMFRMRKGLRDFGVDTSSKLLIFETPMDAQSLFLTGNTEAALGLGFLDLERDGPTVVDVPPMLFGGAVDMWMRNLVEFGPPGLDRGTGGRYLFVPPDHDGAPPEGFFAIKSPTFGVWVGVRGLLVNGKPDGAVARLRTTKIHPLSEAEQPPPMTYRSGSGKAIDTIFPDTYEFFEHLAELVDQEPADAVLPPDRRYLASIGIEKGKPFKPDARMRALLADAARVGSAMARVNAFASRDPERAGYDDRHWEWGFGADDAWDAKGYVNAADSGSEFLWTPRDRDGAFLDGAKNYRLHLPPKVPVKQFWSVVVYDAVSRSELQNGEKFPSVSQYSGPVANADGSVDVYFGPRAPEGREKNWIKTVPGKGWFPYLRFYGPTEAFFDKTWRPDDIVEMR